MALDYGRRRIGVAVSDPTRTIASPYGTVPGSGQPGEPPSALFEVIEDVQPAEIVVGIPFNMDGSAGAMAQEARRFGRAIMERSGIPVTEWDERLSTAGAQRELRAALPARRRSRQEGLTDRVAAALLLRSYLQRSSSP